jgi:beta-N-acetylhexosaminidase
LVAAVESDGLSTEERDYFSKHPPAGVTLFARNISEPHEINLKSLTSDLQNLKQKNSNSSLPMIVAIDQEGGRVSRIKKNFPDKGAALNLKISEIENYSYEVGVALRDVGVNVNFAPVADILTNQQNTAIGDRAFGTNLDDVVERASLFLRGQNRAGILGCLKHFPGQGAADVDTHQGKAVVDASKEILLQRDIAAFVKLMPEVKMIMISHCIYPAFDEINPASVSRKIITELLKKQIGFGGIVVSDDMNMKALSQSDEEWQKLIIASISAGCDMILVCKELKKYVQALEAIANKAAADNEFKIRLEEASEKITLLRKSI